MPLLRLMSASFPSQKGTNACRLRGDALVIADGDNAKGLPYEVLIFGSEAASG